MCVCVRNRQRKSDLDVFGNSFHHFRSSQTKWRISLTEICFTDTYCTHRKNTGRCWLHKRTYFVLWTLQEPDCFILDTKMLQPREITTGEEMLTSLGSCNSVTALLHLYYRQEINKGLNVPSFKTNSGTVTMGRSNDKGRQCREGILEPISKDRLVCSSSANNAAFLPRCFLYGNTHERIAFFLKKGQN